MKCLTGWTLADPGPAGPAAARPMPPDIAAPWTVSQPDFEPTNGALWLVLMDEMPWASEAWFVELDANGIVFDVAPSDAMSEIPLEQYAVVLIANDQPQKFCDRYNDNLGWFEDYVLAGGVLFVGAASEGSNGSRFGGGFLPGGPPIVEEALEELNMVIAPDHPLVFGAAEEIFGSVASHSGFDSIDARLGAGDHCRRLRRLADTRRVRARCWDGGRHRTDPRDWLRGGR